MMMIMMMVMMIMIMMMMIMMTPFLSLRQITLTRCPSPTDVHEDPSPSVTRLRKISLGRKLLYAAQLGACEGQHNRAAGENSGKGSAGAVALEVMGKLDALDGMLYHAASAHVALPEGRVFEDRDYADKVTSYIARRYRHVIISCRLNPCVSLS
jgi:hypothetical protein